MQQEGQEGPFEYFTSPNDYVIPRVSFDTQGYLTEAKRRQLVFKMRVKQTAFSIAPPDVSKLAYFTCYCVLAEVRAVSMQQLT